MSANLIVDLFDTAQTAASLNSTPVLSGSLIAVSSGAVIGTGINLSQANTVCNVFAAGISPSGQLRIQVQTAPSDVSGQYTDPTSGLPVFPGAFQSGGILWINSGGAGGGLLGAFVSGQAMASGFITGSFFQRPQGAVFARLNTLNEGAAQFGGALTAGFITQFRTTGSGGGFTLSPSSGAVSV